MTERHHRSTKVRKYSRIDLVGQNGNEGYHYAEIEQPTDYVKTKYVQVKLSDLKEILRVSVCDEVREIVAKYL